MTTILKAADLVFCGALTTDITTTFDPRAVDGVRFVACPNIAQYKIRETHTCYRCLQSAVQFEMNNGGVAPVTTFGQSPDIYEGLDGTKWERRDDGRYSIRYLSTGDLSANRFTLDEIVRLDLLRTNGHA